MITRFARLWAGSARGNDLPLDVRGRLVAPHFAHIGSLMSAHAAVLLINMVAVARIDGLWPLILAAGDVTALGLRLFVLYRVRRLPDPEAPRDLLRWVKCYYAIGLSWSALCAVLCVFCNLAGGDETMRFLVVFLMLGVTAGIASRSAGTPRFAMTQIMILLSPFLVVAQRTGRDWWIVLVMAAMYVVAMRSIVRRHYVAFLALIDAERTSQRAQIAVGEREAELRAIFDNAAAGVAEMDLVTNRLIRVNRLYCELYGRDEAELLDHFDLSSMTHPDDRADQARQWAAFSENGQSFDCERRYIRKDGTIVWGRAGVSVSATGTDGGPARLVVVIQDVTERKAAELALRTSQDLLRMALDIGGVGTFRRDYRTDLFTVSPQLLAMHGLPAGETPVSKAMWLATVLPDDAQRYAKGIAEAHAERRAIVTLDYRFRHPARGLRYVETRSRMEYDAAGEPLSSIGVIIDVTERRGAERRLSHLAHHDPLTDLPNRTLFRIRLEAALADARQSARCAVLCLDLDHFKRVNDTRGHPAGDALLKAVTTRLQEICRSSDTIARLGGDEFAVILTPIQQPADLAAFAQRFIAALSAPFDIEGQRITIGTSVGMTVAPDDGLDADRLLLNGDMALYAAKTAGRGTYRRFEPAMDAEIQARAALEADLRQALADGALDVFYQPLVDIAAHRVRGFEALVRWHHPTRGFIAPDAFIPLAETNGLIMPLGAFVLDQACTQAMSWPGSPTIAVNLSATEFNSPTLAETVAAALRRSKLDPKRLELEVTESTMLQNTSATMETLQRLKALGVRISIDDFGVGFSSLSYLQRFPFDRVKIDRSFVAPLGQTRESLAIVGAVIAMCHSLDMETTAEGVETETQLAILSKLGCAQAQGFYFSRPLPAPEVAGLIARFESTPPPLKQALCA